jgi:DNA mismatch repair protein MSH2
MQLQAANTAQNKLKVQLKLSISRLRMTQQKDSAKAKQQRRDMAQLLEVSSHYAHASP